MSSPPLAYVFVFTYDGKRFLEECFQTLIERTAYPNYRIVLIDNGSSDGSGEYVSDKFPNVEVLRISPNNGFSPAANKALSYASDHQAEYAVLCNDDIAIIDPRWLAAAINLAERDSSVGIVAFDEWTVKQSCELPKEVLDTTVEYFNGFSMAMPLRLIELIGGFDEEYFLYGDEDDLGARAQRAGFRVAQLNIPILHYGGGQTTDHSRQSAYLEMRNGVRFCLKNRTPLHALMRAVRLIDITCNPWPLTLDTSNDAHRRIRNSGNLLVNAWLYVRAMAWNLWALPRTFRMRRESRQRIQAGLITNARKGPPRQ